MNVIEKYKDNITNEFDWLDLEYLPNSKGHKLEIYLNESKDFVSELIIQFYILFNKYEKDILVRTLNPEGEWGNFCIDTWDIENDKYNYSPEDKSEPTASYLRMLLDCEIEPTYSGFCKCWDWDKFLHIVISCVVFHKAPYSLIFYALKHGFVFYFHHTGSLGIYYKELNEEVLNIIEIAKIEGLEIKNSNDRRIS